MSKQIIKAFPEEQRMVPKETSMYEVLNISEFFMDTIQGEGINTGVPAAFLRLQDCTLNCVWCDTTEVWRQGNPYTHEELFSAMEQFDLIDKLLPKKGHHLVLTGGSPLKQQISLINFLESFESKYGFRPFVEIENECTLKPHRSLLGYINCWNNSPKLSSSGNSKVARHKPEIIHELSKLDNAWFKFVISAPEDWQEIQMDFIDTGLIHKSQIILMPEGATRKELHDKAPTVVEMAVDLGVRYSTREHIVLWDFATGV